MMRRRPGRDLGQEVVLAPRDRREGGEERHDAAFRNAPTMPCGKTSTIATIAAGIGLAFVLYAFYGSGPEAFLLSLALLAAGGLIYWFRKGRTIPPPEASAA